ncbi:MAG: hypothetical protein ACLT4D_11045 [Blautia faecis]
MDEPFAAIDAKVRKELRRWLKEMVEKVGITSIFVTHDQDGLWRWQMKSLSPMREEWSRWGLPWRFTETCRRRL